MNNTAETSEHEEGPRFSGPVAWGPALGNERRHRDGASATLQQCGGGCGDRELFRDTLDVDGDHEMAQATENPRLPAPCRQSSLG